MLGCLSRINDSIKTNPLQFLYLIQKMIFKLDFDKKKIIGISTFLVVLTGTFLIKNPPNKESKRDLKNFTTLAVSGALPGLISASGELQSERTVNISPKKQGILADILVEAGDQIKKGQLIARMDEGDLLYRLNEHKAEFEKQKASYARRKFLYQEGAISKENYEEHKNLFLKSQARFKQRQIEKIELEIRAPFKGIITSKYAVPGAFITPSKTTSSSSNEASMNRSIVELSQGLEVIAKVPESDIGRIQIGQNANVRVDAFPEERFKAKISEISPRAIKNNNVTSFEVTLLLINSPKQLRIGMTADIEFQTGPTAINTLVPTVAIVTKNGVPGLLLVGKNNQPKFQKVELGTSSGNKTAIIQGINPGDQIFIDLPPWAEKSSN